MSEMTSLQTSLLAGSLSLIPNSTLRYLLLALFVVSTLVHAIHVRRPSVQLRRVEDQIKDIDEIIRHAGRFCTAKDRLSLGEHAVWLLEVKRGVSMVKCRILEATSMLTWKKYRLIAKDIAIYAKDAKRIKAAVELLVEVECQRRLTEDISETETILSGFRHSSGFSASVKNQNSNSSAPEASV
ncbi:hypothetical protein FB45DRAFT_895867 [Roridomyces roridus]|uniref:Uncharacterized protein n=1 Tax=Roridomyces roridus TaxID=1738132 RepID=A0AAD7FY03_9AGAR|nr:hypothetical protein FB45DRAFT_895867 [Roridomyces roridus]